MEFKSLRNIETSFKQMRMFAILFFALCLVTVIASLVLAYSFAEKQREKIYVLDEGKSLILALSQDTKANRPVEAREHIRRFHELFFTLAPESKAIEDNINRALALADETAYRYYTDLSEQRYYTRLISTNTNQLLEIDSIVCNFDYYPYEVTTYAREKILRKSNTTLRSLVTQCRLINTVRSDNNPQGFQIQDFRILQNQDIKSDDRLSFEPSSPQQ